MEADSEFIPKTSPRLCHAADAAHNGDPRPFLELWSTTDPVTVFGAVASATGGWDEVHRTLRGVVSRFSGGTPLDFQLVAAEVGRRAGLHGRLRTLRGVLRRRPAQADRPARHPHLPP
jgi:hypothetical protein